MTGVDSLPMQLTGLPESFGWEVVLMTDYEIIMVILGIVGLPISTGVFIIALLNYLDKRK